MDNELTEGFWTPDQAADYLNLAVKSLANDRVTGQLGIPHYKFGQLVRYSPPEVRQYAAARRRISTANKGAGRDVA